MANRPGYHAAYYQSNKEKFKAANAARRAANPEKARAEVRACWQDPEKKAKYLAKRAEWYPAYAPIARERAKKWAKENAEYVKEQSQQRGKKWREKNPDKSAAKTRLYLTRKSKRSPPWLTAEQIQEIAGFYAEAKRLTETTGTKHHVDHIVPLCGKAVSGLHVPWNLQVLTARENISKSNHY